MSFDRRYGDEQRRVIVKLKAEGRSGSEISRLCAQGIFGVEPFQVGRDVANRIAREDAFLAEDDSPVSNDELQRRLRVLVKQAISVVERQFVRMSHPRAKVSSMEVKRLASSVESLRKTLAAMPPDHQGNGHANGNGSGFLEQLAAGSE